LRDPFFAAFAANQGSKGGGIKQLSTTSHILPHQRFHNKSPTISMA